MTDLKLLEDRKAEAQTANRVQGMSRHSARVIPGQHPRNVDSDPNGSSTWSVTQIPAKPVNVNVDVATATTVDVAVAAGIQMMHTRWRINVNGTRVMEICGGPETAVGLEGCCDGYLLDDND